MIEDMTKIKLSPRGDLFLILVYGVHNVTNLGCRGRMGLVEYFRYHLKIVSLIFLR